MANVFVVRYSPDEGLTVSVGDKKMTMEEFVQSHIPKQISNLTRMYPDAESQEYIALMVAEQRTSKAAT